MQTDAANLRKEEAWQGGEMCLHAKGWEMVANSLMVVDAVQGVQTDKKDTKVLTKWGMHEMYSFGVEDLKDKEASLTN